MPYAYRKSERIRKNSEFVSVMKGKRLSVDGLSLFYTRNDTGHFRIGISVSRKLANAIKRNRLKRQIRASIMKTLRQTDAGYDLVFVGRPGLSSFGYEQILKAVETVLRRSVIPARPRTEGAAQ